MLKKQVAQRATCFLLSDLNTNAVHFELGFFVVKSAHDISVYHFPDFLQKAIRH